MRSGREPDDEHIEIEELVLEPLPDEPPPRKPRSIRPWIANAVTLALLASLVVMLNRNDHRPPTSVFPDRTGQVLIFEDNQNTVASGDEYAGAIALVDLDHRIVVRRLLVGNRNPGHGSFLLRLRRSIVYGYDRVYASRLDGGDRKLLGTSSIAIPGQTRGRVLILRYPSEPELGVPSIREPGHAGRGRGLFEDPSAHPVVPARAIPGGIAYDSPNGIVLWDYVHQREIGRLGSRQSYVTTGSGDRLMWCEEQCRTLHLTRLGGRDGTFRAPKGLRFSGGIPPITRFSPDGRFVAATAGAYIRNAWVGRAMVLIDTKTGEVRVAYLDPSKLPLGCTIDEIGFAGCSPPYVAGPVWSTNGKHLYFAIFDQQLHEIAMGEYSMDAHRVMHIAQLPIPGAYAPTAYDPRDVAGMLRVPLSRRCMTDDLTVDHPTCAQRF